MQVFTSLTSIDRGASAPIWVANKARYAANHIHDMGEDVPAWAADGIAKLYGASIVQKENELAAIFCSIKAALRRQAFFQKDGLRTFSIACQMNGQPRTLDFTETASHVEVAFGGNDSGSGYRVFKKIANFDELDQQFSAYSVNDADSVIECHLTPDQQKEKEQLGDSYDNKLTHSENIIAAINQKHEVFSSDSHRFVLKEYAFALGKGGEFIVPKNVVIDDSCSVKSGQVTFYDGRLTAKGVTSVVIAAGPDAIAVAEHGALAIAIVPCAKAIAKAHSTAIANAPDSKAYAEEENSRAIANKADSKTYATHHGALAIAAVEKASAFATASGAKAEAAALKSKAYAIVSGSSSSSTVEGAIAYVDNYATGEAMVAGAIVKANGLHSVISGVPGAIVEQL